MQPETRTKTATRNTSATTAAKAKAVTRAPWPDDLDQRVRNALALPDIATLPSVPYDIVIIGAGVAGLNAALGARSAGARVLVLEAATTIGTGATGRNAGILSAGINMGLADVPEGDPDAEMWPATTRELLSLVEQARQPDALLIASLTGALSLAENRTAARHLAQEARARVNAGLRAEMWSPDQVAEATAGRLNTSTLVEALWLPDEGRIQPLTLLAHLAQKARAAGITLAGNARVASWEHTNAKSTKRTNARWRFSLANGATIEAPGLLLAVGPTAQPTGRLYALAFRANLPDTFPLFWDSAPYTYCDFRPGHGRLTVSGGRYGKPGAAQRDYVYHRRLANAARHWLPELASKEPTYTWAVDIAVTSDMLPRARRLDGHAPGYSIEGLGALGVLPGTVLGRRAGEQLARELA